MFLLNLNKLTCNEQKPRMKEKSAPETNKQIIILSYKPENVLFLYKLMYTY